MMPAGYHTRSFTASNLPYQGAALDSICGDPDGSRTRVLGMKTLRLYHLTTGPLQGDLTLKISDNLYVIDCSNRL